MTDSTEARVTRYISFDDERLEISCDSSSIGEYIDRAFSQMLVQKPERVVAHCRIEKMPFGWRLFGVETLSYEAEPFSEFLSAIKDEVRLQFMRRRPDLLWLHGAALQYNDGAVILCGDSGQGKSTLAVELMGRGWKLLSDDIAPLGPDGAVRPFPQTPEKRIHPGVELRQEHVTKLSREWAALDARQVSHRPVEIRSVVFVEYDSAIDARMTMMEPGSVAFQMLHHLMNFPDHKSRAVDRAALIAARTRGYCLSYSSPLRAGSLVNREFRN